jgi:hypothetical protein
MTKWIAVLVLALVACAPQIDLEPGEVVYQVDTNSTLGVGSPAIARVAQALATYYALEARPLDGYGKWIQRQNLGFTAVYASERRDGGQVVATVEMRWAFARRQDGLISVRLNTLSNNDIDAGAIEGPAFSKLDSEFRRIASSR